MKKMMDYMEEANAIVPRMSGAGSGSAYNDADAVFIDVRDANMIADSGIIKGAHHIPRGLFEFVADEESPMFNPLFDKSKDLLSRLRGRRHGGTGRQDHEGYGL